jgi:hypothetical protein
MFQTLCIGINIKHRVLTEQFTSDILPVVDAQLPLALV